MSSTESDPKTKKCIMKCYELYDDQRQICKFYRLHNIILYNIKCQSSKLNNCVSICQNQNIHYDVKY